jgi:hypothetical protein
VPLIKRGALTGKPIKNLMPAIRVLLKPGPSVNRIGCSALGR